jgi:hypothetical protein
VRFVESVPTLFRYAFLIQLPADPILIVPKAFKFTYGSEKRLGIEAQSVLVVLCV